MSVQRKPSLNIILPKSPKRYLSPLISTKNYNSNIIRLDSSKNSKFSKTHKVNSNIQIIVENFLNTRYSEPQFPSPSINLESNMIIRIKQVLKVNNKRLGISEYITAHKEKIKKILAIVEEETLKTDEKIEDLSKANEMLKKELAKVNIIEVYHKKISVDEVLKVLKSKSKELSEDLMHKINLIKSSGSGGIDGNIENSLEKIVNGDVKRLAGAICDEILKYKTSLGEKSDELRALSARRVELECKIRDFNEREDEIRGEIDLSELAETWTDVSYSDECGKKGFLSEN